MSSSLSWGLTVAMFYLKGFAAKSGDEIRFLEDVENSACLLFLRDADFYTREDFTMEELHLLTAAAFWSCREGLMLKQPLFKQQGRSWVRFSKEQFVLLFPFPWKFCSETQTSFLPTPFLLPTRNSGLIPANCSTSCRDSAKWIVFS